MIIPIGHEQTTVRRLPWVTFTIMIVCVLAFLMTEYGSSRGDPQEAFDALGRYFMSHPYLEIEPEFKNAFWGQMPGREDRSEAATEALKQFSDAPSDPDLLAREQARLDELKQRFRDTLVPPAFRTWGLVPAHLNPLALITHMFLHGGWMHLLGNLFFLYLTAPFIEDVWGRPLFTAFYLGAGVFAALLFVAHYPSLDGPLIGASGAIAGVMGAFCIRYWHIKIKFFYWFGIFFRGTFNAPAWLALALWFLRELLVAQGMDVVAPGSGGGGTAYWAHVWGFAGGVGVALAVKHFKLEEKYIDRAIEEKVTLVDNTAVEEALAAAREGRVEQAIESLRAELAANPANVDAAIAIWNVGRGAGMAEEVAPHLLRALRGALRSGDHELVTTYWSDLVEAAPGLPIDPALAVRVAELHDELGLAGVAGRTVERSFGAVGMATPPGVLARLIRLASRLSVGVPAAFLVAAKACPELPEESREALAGLRLAESSGGDAEAAGRGEAPGERLDEEAGERGGEPTPTTIEPSEVPVHTLRMVEAVPRTLSVTALSLEVGEATKRLELDQIQAIAVAGIAGEGARPYLVVDLLLDPVWSEKKELRLVRLNSTRFDPRRLVGGDDAMAAMRSFLAEILVASEAVPLPDPDGARGTPFRTFASLAAYQHEVLGVG